MKGRTIRAGLHLSPGLVQGVLLDAGSEGCLG